VVPKVVRLRRGRVAEHTPRLLNVEVSWCLPHVVECSEHDEVRADTALDRADGSGLVGWRGNGILEALATPWPAGFSDHGVLSTTSAGNGLHLGENPWTGVGSLDVTVKVWVSVGSGVVGSLAKSWVGLDGNKGVDSDDLASVAGSREKATGGRDGRGDGADGSGTRVDELVTDGDGVEVRPVTVGSSDDGGDLGSDLGDVVNTGKDLHALGLGDSEDVLDLVAVGTVDTDHVVVAAVNLSKVGGDLCSGLAANVARGDVSRVWRVRDTAHARARSRRRYAGAGSWSGG